MICPITPIGKVVDKVTSWDPRKTPSDHLFPYIDISSVDRNAKRITDVTQSWTHVAPSRARQIVKAGDVLISTVRPNLNTVAQVPPELDNATASTGFCVLRPNQEKLDVRYLYYWVQTPSFVSEMVKRATGANYPAVSDTIIKESCLPLPPLPEQRRIAAILDKADAIRRKRQQTIARMEDFLRSVFLEMFGDPVTNLKGWEIHQLGQHIKFITSGSRGWARYYATEGSRFLRSLDVQMNQISDEEPVYVNAPDNAEANRTRVEPGDVLLTITGSRIGRVAAVPSNIREAYISQHVAIIRLDVTIKPRFLSMFLSDLHGGQHQISRMQYGQTKPGLNLTQIRLFEVPCPPLCEQEKFLAIWNRLEALEEKQKASFEGLSTVISSLSHLAFHGELTNAAADEILQQVAAN